MSHATNAIPAYPAALDRQHGQAGPLTPCALCQIPALTRCPATGGPCHTGCVGPG